MPCPSRATQLSIRRDEKLPVPLSIIRTHPFKAELPRDWRKRTGGAGLAKGGGSGKELSQ